MSLHRRTEEADIFLLLPKDGALLPMHESASRALEFPESETYSLRTDGEREFWDPLSGNAHPLPDTRQGGWIQAVVPFAVWSTALVVCAKCESARTPDTGGRGRYGSCR